MDAVNRRRAWGYPLAAVATGALIYGGFIYRADPDPWTLLSSADVQLRLASGMPEKDKDGQPLAARQRLLQEVRAALETVERNAPEIPEAKEYWAFLCRLEGRFPEAVQHYREGRGVRGLEPDLRDSMLFNEVRTLQQWGKTEEALSTLEEGRDGVQQKYLEDADLMIATLHQHSGDDESAVRVAESVSHRNGVSAMGRVRSGKILEDLGHVAQAEVAYRLAGESSGTGLYYRARLKVAQGAADNALELLEQAAAAVPAQVADYLKRDEANWESLAANARFQQIISPSKVEAKPSR